MSCVHMYAYLLILVMVLLYYSVSTVATFADGHIKRYDSTLRTLHQAK